MTFAGLNHMICTRILKAKAVSNPPVPPFPKGGSEARYVCPLFLKGGRRGFNGGFTLVEVIVTIIAVSIVSVIFMNFMGKAMSKSAQAVELVQGEASAEALLECIVAEYVFRMNQFSSPDPLAALAGDINGKRICGLNNRTFGATAAYISFDANGNEIPPGPSPRTLKVTVTAPGNDLTALLTLSRNANSPPIAF